MTVLSENFKENSIEWEDFDEGLNVAEFDYDVEDHPKENVGEINDDEEEDDPNKPMADENDMVPVFPKNFLKSI